MRLTASAVACWRASSSPDAWTPHLTLAPRLHLDQLPTVARHAFEVLPIDTTLDRAALIDTSTGDLHPLPRLL